jgi:hypothetical protein
MSEALSAAQAVAYAALSAGVTLAQVFQHVPEGTDPAQAVVIIGDIQADAESIASKDDQDKEITLSIVSVIKARGTKPLFAIQAQVEAALDKLEASQGGWTLHFIAKDSEAILVGDGEIYVGKNNYTVLAFGA